MSIGEYERPMKFSPEKAAPLKGLFGKGLNRAPSMLHLGGGSLPSYFTELRLSRSTPGTSASTLANGEVESEETDTKDRSPKGKSSFLDKFIAGGTEDTPVDDPSLAQSLNAGLDAPKARSSKSPTLTLAPKFPSPESRVVTNEYPWGRSPPKPPEEVALAEFAAFEAKLSRRGASAPSAQQTGMMEFAALERKLSRGGSEKTGDKSVESHSKSSDGVSVGLAEPMAPEASECCGNGCANCVWIDYWERLQKWEEAQAEAGDGRTPPP